MQNFTKEFREFIDRGNVLDLAVAVVLGAAFAPIIEAIVQGLLTPIIAAIFGQPDFTSLAIDIGDAQILYGLILTRVIEFVLVALALFLFVVKPWNAYQARQAEEVEDEDEGPSETELLTEIRDALRSR
ncbi:MAG: large conductance mechanosensitive channel protein MscL [Actinomycetota bacterium]